MASLYEISKEYLVGFQALSEMELDDQTFENTLEAISGDFENKTVNVVKYFANLDAEAKMIKEAEQQMATRRKAIEAHSQRLKDYLRFHMEATGITKVSCPFFQVSLSKAADKVVIASEKDLPEEFIRTKVTREPDKIAIKEALKYGDVPGAYLQPNTALRIK